MTIAAILFAFTAGLLLGGGVAAYLYANTIEIRAKELARKMSDDWQRWQRIGQFTREGVGQ